MSRQHRSSSSGVVRIGPQDIEMLRRRGEWAVAYYHSIGLAEVRSRAVSLAFSGAIPIVGWLLLDWSPASMLVFMLADAAITVVLDLLRYPLARPAMQASHSADHEAGEILGIADGLEDGSGTRPARNNRPAPGLILFFGVVSTLFLVPIAAAAIEPIGMASIREVLDEPGFAGLLVADFALRLCNALWTIFRARKRPPGEIPVFIESGGVAVLYAGLLILIWLPIQFGAIGLLAMFGVLYLTRIAFAFFALWWTPRAVAAMQRRVRAGDFLVRQSPGQPGLP